MTEVAVTLHALAGPEGTALGRWLADGPAFPGSFHPLVGPHPRPIAAVTGPAGLLARAGAGLPRGPARAEAAAVRLRRTGVEISWGPPREVPDLGGLLRFARAWGSSSIGVLRADPSLLPELRAGAWFQAGWRARLIRRVAVRTARAVAAAGDAPLAMRTAADAAFWAGVRSAATRREWRRLTKSSYVALCYHRVAGEDRPGEENLDVPPERFHAQLRALGRLGFRPVSPERLLAFHRDPGVVLPRRSYVVTADDAFADLVRAIQPHLGHRPQLFVPTERLGGTATWMANEPVAGWDAVAAAAAGGAAIGSHSRTHAVLTGLGPEELRGEVAGSLSDLGARLATPLPVLAYPQGRHDEEVRRAAADAGYAAAYTTEVGRNGAGTDPFCLRRIGVHGRDSLPAFLWKVLTGELVPPRWERRQLSRARRGSRPARRSSTPPARRGDGPPGEARSPTRPPSAG